MGLKDLQLPEATIEFSGGAFVVRGLGLGDITLICRKHAAFLSRVFERVGEQMDGDLGTDAIGVFALDLVETAPDIVAEIIAYGAGEPDLVDVARKLPGPVQLEALEQIGKFTFDVAGGPKKVVETVIRIAQNATSLLTDLQA